MSVLMNAASECMVRDFLSAPEVAALVGVSVNTIYKYRRAGAFPEPVHVGPRLVRWPRTLIESWLGQS